MKGLDWTSETEPNKAKQTLGIKGEVKGQIIEL